MSILVERCLMAIQQWPVKESFFCLFSTCSLRKNVNPTDERGMSPDAKQAIRKRSCGPCRACCTHLLIESKAGYSTRLDNGEDVAKPAHTPCRFLSAEGCGIYQFRPIVCRQFLCDWRQGRQGFAADSSPDRMGFIGVRGTLIAASEEESAHHKQSA